MGKFNNIVWIEIELTSFCNAAWPGCRRKFSKNKYDLLHLTLSDIKKFFPNKDYIENKHFRFSGVLGEPIVNPECLDITKYFLDNNGAVSYSTNGGAQSIKWWNEVGILSNSTKKLKVDFKGIGDAIGRGIESTAGQEIVGHLGKTLIDKLFKKGGAKKGDSTTMY